MKKIKRILALVAIILLLSLYLVTFIVALMPGHQDILRGCIAATILLPVLLYAFILAYRRAKDKEDS